MRNRSDSKESWRKWSKKFFLLFYAFRVGIELLELHVRQVAERSKVKEIFVADDPSDAIFSLFFFQGLNIDAVIY